MRVFKGAIDDIDLTGRVGRDAEARGYDGLWVPETVSDPFLLAMAAISATSRLQVGTGIAVAFARSPMTVAVAANDLQVASQGRFILGLGTQIKPHITRRFSMPWSQPAARMSEFVQAIRAIWASWETDEPLRFEGEFYNHTLMTPFFSPGPNPYGNPPIVVAAVGERMTEVVSQSADGVSTHGFTTERYLREVTMPAIGRGRAKASHEGPQFQVSGSVFIVTGRTEEEVAAARAGVADRIAFYGSTPAYRPVLDLHGWGALHEELNAMSKRGLWDEMGGQVDDEVLNAFAVVGEPEAVGPELLRRYGDLLDRTSLYTPHDLDEEIRAVIRESVQQGHPPRRP